VSRRPVSSAETRRANRSWWDGDAEAYLAEHGEFLGAADFCWCPEGLREAQARLLGEVAGRRVLEVGCGAAQCARWLAAAGAYPVGLDLSAEMLAAGARLSATARQSGAAGARQSGTADTRQPDHAGTRQASTAGVRQSGAAGVRQSGTAGARQPDRAGTRQASTADVRQADASGARHSGSRGVAVPLVQGDAERLPFADRSFDLACSAHGAVPFCADSAAVMREVARVLRPGGRWVFATPHPVRWMFADDPGPQGLVAGMSYFDRRPYVEEGADGVASYVEHHRTLGDRVREITAAGLVLVDLVEPEWPAGHQRVWGQWSPLRGAILPGTAIYVCVKP